MNKVFKLMLHVALKVRSPEYIARSNLGPIVQISHYIFNACSRYLSITFLTYELRNSKPVATT
jgi:hypothetical protein